MEETEKIVWYLTLPGKMAGDMKSQGDQAKDGEININDTPRTLQLTSGE